MIENPMFIETHRLAEFNPRGTDVPVVLDLMIHDIDAILSVVHSKVKNIHASGISVISETPIQAGPPAFVSPGVGARQCPHGTMTRIHGLTGKFGPYKGHFCPAKQGDPTKCTTVYVKANTPEFATFVADQTKA